jgi:hypothetical protein
MLISKEALSLMAKKRTAPMKKIPPAKTGTMLPKGYEALLRDIKERIKSAREYRWCQLSLWSVAAGVVPAWYAGIGPFQ